MPNFSASFLVQFKSYQTYQFGYDAFGNNTTVGISGKSGALVTKAYGARNGVLESITYGSGDSLNYEYDNLDRVTKVKYNNRTVKSTYSYGADGSIGTVGYRSVMQDNYTYDSLGRLLEMRTTKSRNTLVQKLTYDYDSENRVTKYTYYDGKNMRPATYTYNADGTLNVFSPANGDKITYRYTKEAEPIASEKRDTLKALQTKVVEHDSNSAYTYKINYQYETATSDANRLTGRVSRLRYLYENQNDFSYDYEYDAAGNISRVKTWRYKNGELVNETLAEYTYDSQNRLTEEKNYTANITIQYTYDNFGNLRKATKYGGTSGLVYLSEDTFTMSTSGWRDQMTSVNGNAITYDGAGNPTEYYDGTELIWEGRELSYVGKTNGNQYSYFYNADGIRDMKQVFEGSSFITHEYRLMGDKVVEDKWGTNKRLVFMYDENGAPNTVYYYNNSTSATKYYYVLNLQGDVMEIRSESNALVAQYNYDAFGNILSIKSASGANITSSTHIANVNPLRYRGYFYDSETGFYYLNSRYYDPATRRFISADNVIDSSNFQGFNLYSYCKNNPVMYYDPNGKSALAIIGLGTLLASTLTLLTSSSPEKAPLIITT